MKKITLIYLVTLMTSLLSFAIIYIVMNPKLENSIFIHNKPIEKSSFLTSKYLFEKLKENKKYIVVFGTSRSAKISSKLYGENIINFSESVYGNPYDVMNLINQLSTKQIANISKILYLVDNHTFRERGNYDINYSRNFIFKQLINFNTENVFLSIKSIFNYNLSKGINLDGSFFNNNESSLRLYECDRYKYEKVFDGMHVKTFEALKDIKKFAQQNNINIIFFTSTMNIPYLSNINKKDFMKHRENLITNIGEFYDFTYIDGISNNHNAFTDVTHITTKETIYMINHFYKNPPSSYLVNKESFTNFYNKLFDKVESFDSTLF